jgi:prevent-host-death family protein
MMKAVTTHQAKTHLSRLLKEVQTGETIVILSGSVPVAQLTAVEPSSTKRPKVGTHTSESVRYEESVFRPLMDEELEEWGL